MTYKGRNDGKTQIVIRLERHAVFDENGIILYHESIEATVPYTMSQSTLQKFSYSHNVDSKKLATALVEILTKVGEAIDESTKSTT